MSDTDEAAMRGRPRAHGTKRRSVIVIIVMMMVLLVLLMFLMLFMMVMVASVREVIFIFMLHAQWVLTVPQELVRPDPTKANRSPII